jgi:hypothetical protein
MTDLEMTKLCAEAMGLELKLHDVVGHEAIWLHRVYDQADTMLSHWTTYMPLHDDAQAMALVKKFALICAPSYPGLWHVEFYAGENKSWYAADYLDLNRAIVECVAKMQASK